MIKRYTLSSTTVSVDRSTDGPYGVRTAIGRDADVTPDAAGQWVKYEDHLDAMTEAGGIIGKLREEIARLEQTSSADDYGPTMKFFRD